MATPIMPHCPGCGQPLDYYQSAVHPRSTRPPTWMGTCKTTGCKFHEKTASDIEWQAFANDPAEQQRYIASIEKLTAKHAVDAASLGGAA